MNDAPDVIVLATGGTIDKSYSLTGQLKIADPAAIRLFTCTAEDVQRPVA